MAHTPGPWGGICGQGRYRAVNANGSTLCEVVSRGGDVAELEANAQLIAAAPDLLAALKLVHRKVLVEQHARDSYVRMQVEAAIAKAEGRYRPE